MAVLAFLVLILAMTGHTSANWCVCKNGVSEGVLQKALDYACGAGADCNPIHSNGACYNPNTVLAHCNYAVNSYFQKKGQQQGSCDFAGAATITASDPSVTGCNYPASASSSSTSSSPVSTTPSTSTGTNTGTGTGTGTTPSSTGTTSTTSPYSTTPSTGVLGGMGGGMGPTGAGINTDESGGFRLARTSVFSSSVTLFISGLMLWWG